ncbi:MAG: sulfite exporter TauE/SafE family protein [Phenylobacterium sp.]|nr:sulfite exporter TauE/SafE family protein [Phenylobacterium sp.]
MSMIPTSIRSALAHRKHGAVDTALLRLWALPALSGALVAVAAAWAKGPVLMTIFAVFATLAALHMALGKDTWRIAQQLPGRIGQSVMAFVIACVSVMIGIGGGAFTVPTLTLFGHPVHRAVGTAAAIGVLIAIPGAIGFAISGLGRPLRPPYSLGYANLIGVALIVPSTVIAAPWGAALAHKLDRKWLRRAFALFLGATGLKMALSLM